MADLTPKKRAEWRADAASDVTSTRSMELSARILVLLNEINEAERLRDVHEKAAKSYHDAWLQSNALYTVEKVAREACHEQVRNLHEVADREQARADRLTHLLGSHADGHRCTCECLDPGVYFGSNMHPPEYEQDPWCPTHPNVDQIRQEFDREKAAREEAERSLVELRTTDDAKRDYEWGWNAAVVEFKARADKRWVKQRAALDAEAEAHKWQAARAEKAEQERDEAMASRSRLIHENNLALQRGEAAEARVAELEAGIKRLADEWTCPDDGLCDDLCESKKFATGLHALIEKEAHR